MGGLRRRLLHVAEGTSWAVGLVGLVWWGVVQIGMTTATRHELARFSAIQAASAQGGTPDQSLWSAKRISEWRKAVSTPGPAPIAVLRIAKIRLEVPVLPGTDDLTLERGVGHIEDTARPGAVGNSGLAGHRDSFFRGLKDIAPGDTIEVTTLTETIVYRIERTWVVMPEDVSVLDPTPTRALTLVTCYPFYFAGSAPQRFIVRAVEAGDERVIPPLSSEGSVCPRCGMRPIVALVRPSHIP